MLWYFEPNFINNNCTILIPARKLLHVRHFELIAGNEFKWFWSGYEVVIDVIHVERKTRQFESSH